MYRTLKRLAVAGLVTVGMPLGLISTAADAATPHPGTAHVASVNPTPAVSCYGYSCHGHDPYRYGCSKSSDTTAPANYQGTQVATLWNWYSVQCNANWSEGALTTAGLNAGDSIIIDISTTDSHGYWEYMCYPGPDDTGALLEYCSGAHYGGAATAWTDMVDGTNKTVSDLYVYDRNGNQITYATTSQ